MRIDILGSGSRGNALVISSAQGAILIDCGFARRTLQERLQLAGIAADSIRAIFVTHEHGDHSSGVGPAARAWKIPVHATHGTTRKSRFGSVAQLQTLVPGGSVRVAGLEILAFPVPHDAAEPVQFVISDGQQRVGVLSDAGHVTPHMRDVLDGCDTLLLEANHCPDMLAAGPYPPALQARVGGAWGHLSNGQSAELLTRLDRSRIGRVVLTHLSEHNNTPELALQTIRAALPDWSGELLVAAQDHPTLASGERSPSC